MRSFHEIEDVLFKELCNSQSNFTSLNQNVTNLIVTMLENTRFADNVEKNYRVDSTYYLES